MDCREKAVSMMVWLAVCMRSGKDASQGLQFGKSKAQSKSEQIAKFGWAHHGEVYAVQDSAAVCLWEAIHNLPALSTRSIFGLASASYEGRST